MTANEIDIITSQAAEIAELRAQVAALKGRPQRTRVAVEPMPQERPEKGPTVVLNAFGKDYRLGVGDRLMIRLRAENGDNGKAVFTVDRFDFTGRAEVWLRFDNYDNTGALIKAGMEHLGETDSLRFSYDSTRGQACTVAATFTVTRITR